MGFVQAHVSRFARFKLACSCSRIEVLCTYRHSHMRLKQQQQQYSDKMVDVPVGAVHRRFDVPVIMPRRYFVTVKVPQIQFIGRNLRLRVDFSFLDAPRTQASSLLPLDPPHVLHSRLHVVKLTWSTYARECVNTCSFFHFVSGSNVHMEDLVSDVVIPHLSFSCLPSRAEIGGNLNSSS